MDFKNRRKRLENERYVYVSRVCSRSFLMASTFVLQRRRQGDPIEDPSEQAEYVVPGEEDGRKVRLRFARLLPLVSDGVHVRFAAPKTRRPD